MVGVCYEADDLFRDLWQLNLVNYDIVGFERNLDPEEIIRSGENIVGIVNESELPEVPIVLVSPKNARYVPGTESLIDFVHPKECIYWFGPDNRHVTEAELLLINPVAKVFIPTGEQVYWSGQAASVVLYDRQLKNG